MESSKNKLRKGIITCPEFVEVAGSIAVADASLNPAYGLEPGLQARRPMLIDDAEREAHRRRDVDVAYGAQLLQKKTEADARKEKEEIKEHKKRLDGSSGKERRRGEKRADRRLREEGQRARHSSAYTMLPARVPKHQREPSYEL